MELIEDNGSISRSDNNLDNLSGIAPPDSVVKSKKDKDKKKKKKRDKSEKGQRELKVRDFDGNHEAGGDEDIDNAIKQHR